MSRVCSICQRGRMTGNTVSHSNRKAGRVWNVNLQKVKLKGKTGKSYVCTNCLKSGKADRV
ncbi:MAG: 50S ribosomal protein L28 [Clostridiales bacterium]|nr:50S ribosomal protein L28 [Clostridiales bacterium]